MPRDRPSSRKWQNKIAESGPQHGPIRSDRANVIRTAGVAPAVLFYGTGLLEDCLFQQRKYHVGASAPVVRPETENRALASVVRELVQLQVGVGGRAASRADCTKSLAGGMLRQLLGMQRAGKNKVAGVRHHSVAWSKARRHGFVTAQQQLYHFGKSERMALQPG